MEGNCWNLLKYARYDYKKENWIQIDSFEGSPLNIKIENSRLVIKNNSTILETICLLKSFSDMRILNKDDIVVFILKIQNQTRRFRVQFAPNTKKTSEVLTEEFLTMIRNYVHIEKKSSEKQEDLKKNSITLGDAFQNYFIKNNKHGTHKLPKYDPLPKDFPLELMVQECILDQDFPDICQQINKFLDKLK